MGNVVGECPKKNFLSNFLGVWPRDTITTPLVKAGLGRLGSVMIYTYYLYSSLSVVTQIITNYFCIYLKEKKKSLVAVA